MTWQLIFINHYKHFCYIQQKYPFFPGMQSQFEYELVWQLQDSKKCAKMRTNGCHSIKHSIENSHLLTISGFSKAQENTKVDYFDVNLLNKKMVVAKRLTKSGLLTILRLTKSGFHCRRLYTKYV